MAVTAGPVTGARPSTIGTPSRDGDGWTAQLIVDETDPVMFDHSVDHVPGMLMLHGIAELVERVGTTAGGGRMASTFNLDFTRFLEKDLPSSMTITPAGPAGTWRVAMTQSGRLACAGTVATLALDDGDTPPVDSFSAATRAEASLVHRQRPENVVVSPLRPAQNGYSVDYLSSEAARTHRFAHVHGALDIVEAARQFMILLSHTACGFDLRQRLILKQLVVTMPQPFPRADPVRLFCPEPRTSGGRLDFAMHARCGARPAATVSWHVSAVTDAGYQRLRGAAA